MSVPLPTRSRKRRATNGQAGSGTDIMAVTPYSPPPPPPSEGMDLGRQLSSLPSMDSGELDLLMSMIAEPGGGGGGEPPLPRDPRRPPAPRPPAAPPPRGPDGVTARGWRGRGRGRPRRGPRRACGRRAHAHRPEDRKATQRKTHHAPTARGGAPRETDRDRRRFTEDRVSPSSKRTAIVGAGRGAGGGHS